MTKRYRPFSNGTEFTYWDDANCCQCALDPYQDGGDSGICDIFDALTVAYWDDGTISEDIAVKMGYPENAYAPSGLPYLGWLCREFRDAPPPEPSEAAKMYELGMPCLPGFEREATCPTT